MGESRPLGILVFDAAGTLLRYSKEAAELTGYSSEEVPSREDWCERLFPDAVNRAIVKAALQEMAAEIPAGQSRSFEFSLPFRTADGEFKDGQFTIAVTCSTEENPEPLFLISLLEKVTGRPSRPAADNREVLGQALAMIHTARENVAAIVEESQDRVIAATNRIRGDQVAMSHQWDELFQEAFALARIRDQVEVIRESVSIAYEASRSDVQQADPDRPLMGVAVGKPVALPLGLSLHKLERFWILSTLQALHGNRSDCARHLDIALRTVRNKLGEYKTAGFKIPSSARGRRVKAQAVA